MDIRRDRRPPNATIVTAKVMTTLTKLQIEERTFMSLLSQFRVQNVCIHVDLKMERREIKSQENPFFRNKLTHFEQDDVLKMLGLFSHISRLFDAITASQFVFVESGQDPR